MITNSILYFLIFLPIIEDYVAYSYKAGFWPGLCSGHNYLVEKNTGSKYDQAILCIAMVARRQ